MRGLAIARVGEPRGEQAPAGLTVDELLEAPERVAELTRTEATRLVARLSALTPVLVIRAMEREPEPAAAAPRDELLKVAAVAERLSMTRGEVYALIRSGVLPAVTKGARGVRVSTPVLDAWIRERSRC